MTRSPSASNSGVRARSRLLEALAAGDPGFVGSQRFAERKNLADLTATVGIGSEQEIFRILGAQRFRIRLGGDDVLQAETLDQAVAIGERLREVLPGIDEDHRRLLVDA